MIILNQSEVSNIFVVDKFNQQFALRKQNVFSSDDFNDTIIVLKKIPVKSGPRRGANFYWVEKRVAYPTEPGEYTIDWKLTKIEASYNFILLLIQKCYIPICVILTFGIFAKELTGTLGNFKAAYSIASITFILTLTTLFWILLFCSINREYWYNKLSASDPKLIRIGDLE